LEFGKERSWSPRALFLKSLPGPLISVKKESRYPLSESMDTRAFGIGIDGEVMANFDHIKAVIFDFDGTLAVLNIDFDGMREQVFELVKHFGVEEKWITERYLLEIIDEVYSILGGKEPFRAEQFYQKAYQILYEVELRAAEKGRLIPGVEGTLTFLRGIGIKVGIITRNCEEAVRKVFPDIDACCDVFISRNSIKRVKPHPDHLSTTMKALNVLKEEAVMIGDHTIDIHAGKRVGMKTIGVLTGRTKKEEFEKAGADNVLSDATEICKLIFPPTLS
jgi:phosphoglycolate phosphatase